MLKSSRTLPLGEEALSQCSCCGRDTYEGEGLLVVGDEEIAHYGYVWACGRESRFTLGVCALSARGAPIAGLVAISARSNGESMIYTVLEPVDSPWGDSEDLGPVLTRRAVLEEGVVPAIFDLVDAIASRESRIYTRVLAEHES